MASAELQSALMAQHKEEAAQEAATAGAAPDNTPANAPAALGPATAAAANPTTPRSSGGYMSCGGTLAQYQVPGPDTPLPTCTPIPDSTFDVVAAAVTTAALTTAARPASQCSPPPDDRGPCDLDRPGLPPTPHYRPP